MVARVMLSLPEPFLEQVDAVAAAEHRSRSDLVREALRRYMQGTAEPVRRPVATAADRGAGAG